MENASSSILKILKWPAALCWLKEKGWRRRIRIGTFDKTYRLKKTDNLLSTMAKIKKTKENSKGRNTHFELPRAQVVKQIEAGILPGYHVRVINGVKTPCSNPDKKKSNNLG